MRDNRCKYEVNWAKVEDDNTFRLTKSSLRSGTNHALSQVHCGKVDTLDFEGHSVRQKALHRCAQCIKRLGLKQFYTLANAFSASIVPSFPSYCSLQLGMAKLERYASLPHQFLT